MLTVIERYGKAQDGAILWRCICKCGGEKIVRGGNLKNGNTKSCGCQSVRRGRRIQRELVGQSFGSLIVVEKLPFEEGKQRWKCICSLCGREKIVYETNLLRSKSKCKCERYKDNIIHGALVKNAREMDECNAKLYDVWTSMRQRCQNSKSKAYHFYGERGISICGEWDKSYVCFREWALDNGYAIGLSIDRIDNEGNYCPENCRWVDQHTQVMNRRNTKRYSMNNETKTLCEWVEEYKVPYRVVYNRLRSGWTFEKAILTPYVSKYKSQRN